MIAYDPKAWFELLFKFEGTVLPRVWVRLVILTGLTVALLLVREFVPEADVVFRPFKPLGHTLIGVALGLLIVFRNNCSYDRYWEGRKLWGGIVNTSRNLVRGAAVYAGESKEFGQLVAGYALALKNHLRGSKDISEVEALVPRPMVEHAASTGNPPSILALYLSEWIRDRTTAGKIDSITAQSLEANVRTLLDNQGGCERILRTPIPFAYAVHIKHLLTLYLLTLPFVLIGEMSWVAIPTVAVIGFGLLGIEEAGVEIEDPFGDDPNDLPIEAICSTIGRDAMALTDAPRA